MSNEGVDPSAVHLNEEDWLQLLQKLTPSSIENLQQTLKRIEKHSGSTPENVKAVTTASQLCDSSISSPAVVELSKNADATTPIVMSLDVAKPPLSSVITVPPGFNLTKSPNTSHLSNAIVLPSSALFIAPSTQGQTFSLDPCVPVSGVNRIITTYGSLKNQAVYLPNSSPSIVDNFTSLNTLANAAVAIAANDASQVHWPSINNSNDSNATESTTVSSAVSELSFNAYPTTTTSTTVGTSLPQISLISQHKDVEEPRLTSVCTKTTANMILSTGEASVATTVDNTNNLQNKSPPNLSHNHPLFTTLGSSSAGLTVYPLQVSGTGSTVLLAHKLDMTDLSGSGTIQTPSITSKKSTGTTTAFVTAIDKNPQVAVAVTSPTPLSTSTPHGKPKFKALYDTNMATSIDNKAASNCASAPAAESLVYLSEVPNTSRLLTSEPLSPICKLPLLRPGIKRQSPTSIARSICQTPKRLAATAATLSEECIQPDGCKKVLLVCPQSSMGSSTSTLSCPSDSGISLSFSSPGSDSMLARVLQPRPSTSVSTKTFRLDQDHVATATLNSSLPLPSLDNRKPFIRSVPSMKPQQQAPLLLAPATSTAVTSSSFVRDVRRNASGISLENEATKSMHHFKRSLKEEPGGSQAGEDEARRRAKRRERNRVAAARCRQRRQDQIEELQQRVDALNKTGRELRTNLETSNTERARLESLIHQHKLSGCKAADDVLRVLSSETPESSLGISRKGVNVTLSGAELNSIGNTKLIQNDVGSGTVVNCVPSSSELPVTVRISANSSLKLEPDQHISVPPITTATTLTTTTNTTTAVLPLLSANNRVTFTASTLPNFDLRLATAQLGQSRVLLSIEGQPGNFLYSLAPMVGNGEGESVDGVDLAETESDHRIPPNCTTTTAAATNSVVATRPSTLIPPLVEESSTLPTKHTSTEVGDNGVTNDTFSNTSRAALGPSATIIPPLFDTSTSTPLLLPPDLNSYSSILTPSALKFFKTLVSGCNSPQQTTAPSLLLTSTLGSLYSTPTVASELFNAGTNVAASLFSMALNNNVKQDILTLNSNNHHANDADNSSTSGTVVSSSAPLQTSTALANEGTCDSASGQSSNELLTPFESECIGQLTDSSTNLRHSSTVITVSQQSASHVPGE